MAIEIKLKTPVEYDGLTFEKLELSELTVAQNVAMQKMHGEKSAIEQDVQFFAMTCGVSPDVILKLGQRDWTRLKTLYWETLGNVDWESESSD